MARVGLDFEEAGSVGGELGISGGRFDGAFRGFDDLARDIRAGLVSAEFHEPSLHNLGEMALVVAFRHLDGFVQVPLLLQDVPQVETGLGMVRLAAQKVAAGWRK